MADVMISYARADQLAADLLARRLEADGFDVWFDREIPPGQTFDEVIDRALHEARRVVVLWSRQSVGSRWVVAEAEEAASMAKLVPARLDDSVIPLEFRRVQAADLIGWSGDADAAGYRVLLATLRNGGQPHVPKQEAPRSARTEPSARSHHPGRWLFLILVLAGFGVAYSLLFDGVEPDPGAPPSPTPTMASPEEEAPVPETDPAASQNGDAVVEEDEAPVPEPEMPEPPAELLNPALLSALFEPGGSWVGQTGATPEDAANLVVQNWTTSIDCEGASQGRVLSITEGEPVLAVVDIALPCMDRAEALFPYSGGFRLQLTIADEAGTWTVTRTMAQVYCPHGVERGALCLSETP